LYTLVQATTGAAVGRWIILINVSLYVKRVVEIFSNANGKPFWPSAKLLVSAQKRVSQSALVPCEPIGFVLFWSFSSSEKLPTLFHVTTVKQCISILSLLNTLFANVKGKI